MAKITNLRTARKQKARVELQAQKAQVVHVRKSEKSRVNLLNTRSEKLLDGHKINGGE